MILDPIAAREAFYDACRNALPDSCDIYNLISHALPTEAEILDAIERGVYRAFVDLFGRD